MSKTISACFLTLNDEDVIRYSIYYPLKHYNEVIVIDGGSMDNTISIIKQTAKELGVENKLKIITNRFKHFSNQRNLYLKNATSEFIHSIDADEVFHEKDIIKIKKEKIEEFDYISYRFLDFWIDFGHFVPITYSDASFIFPRIFKKTNNIEYRKYAPTHLDLDLLYDKKPIREKIHIHYATSEDFFCYHLRFVRGKEKEIRRITNIMKERNEDIPQEKIDEFISQSKFFRKEWWEGKNIDKRNILKFNGQYPDILKEHPNFNNRIIKS